jgi:hypothetical protein
MSLSNALNRMPQLTQLLLDDNVIGLEGSDALWNTVSANLTVRGIF